MLHVLVGAAAGDPNLLHAAKRKVTVPWIVPKAAQPGDAVLFHLPQQGFIARGTIASKPGAVSRNSLTRYSADVGNIQPLPVFVPLAFVADNHREWKWSTYPRTYTTVYGAIESRLNELLDGYQSSIVDDQLSISPLREGAPASVTITTYERNPIARRECIQHYGPACYVCGFDFGAAYGEKANGYIHVHHLKAVSGRGGAYTVNPIRDLRPVCPNCHAVIHLRNPPLSIAELKKMLTRKH
jgi:HNH endonuclease